ncbi:MAG: ECF transporter S component [Propionicimonas sp.]|uniref:ECF transporter S component n=1 Tax=Propionicimonas sp. TaxID=1955623 RepID=UPI002B1EB748|nr:ECF transporter S component [Propionicimonas sp.]MEA4943276.1 ECF transporter S component [Propionicimonas sp.]
MTSRALGGRATGSLVVALVGGLAAFLWPLFLSPDAAVLPAQAPILFALVLPLVLAIVLSELAGGRLDVKALAMLGVLAAVGMILRPLSAGTAGLELIFFLMILGGRVFGPGFGFALGAITMFGSALITGGVGPWLPHQMLAAGFVGLFAGWLPAARGRAEIAVLTGYGMVAAFGYGWLMDFAFWPFSLGGGTDISFHPGAPALENLHRFVLYNLATSMGWNLGRALTNAVLLTVLGTPLLRLLRRAARTASFDIPDDEQPGILATGAQLG